MEKIEIEYDDSSDEVALKFEEALKKLGIKTSWDTKDTTIIFKIG